MTARPYREDDDADWWAVRELLVRSHRASRASPGATGRDQRHLASTQEPPTLRGEGALP